MQPVLYSTAVLAADTGQSSLDEIVVTALRREESILATPYAVNVLAVDDLVERKQVRTIPEALRELPGVMVQKTGHGQGSPYVRGFTGLQTLFLIDGIRLNNSTFRNGPNQYWNTVDSYTVQRLELVKGPASVLYGSDAIGGTVNAISRSYDRPDEQELHGRMVVRGASAENSILARPEIGFAYGNLTVLAGASLKLFGDLHAGGNTGTQDKTGYDEYDADVKVTWDISSDRYIVAAIQHVDLDDAWRSHKTGYAKSWLGTTTGSDLRHALDQTRTLGYLQYYADNVDILDGGSFTVSLSHHQQDEMRDRTRQNLRSERQGTEVGTLGLWGQIHVPWNRGSWTAGVEFYRDDVDSFKHELDALGDLTRERIQGPVADDARYSTVGAFVQNSMRVGEKGELIAGARYSLARVDARSVERPGSGDRMSVKDDWTKLTGSLRYSHALGASSSSRFFAGISEGFRAPNLSDLTRFDIARSNEIETPATTLRPERFVTVELGIKRADSHWSGQLSVFSTAINDMIVRVPTGQLVDGFNEVTKQNSGHGYVHGIELQGDYWLNETWKLFGNIAWIDGEIDTFQVVSSLPVREPLDRLMPVQLYLGSRFQPPDDSYWVEMLVSSAARQDLLSSRDQSDTDRIPALGTPGYALVTVRSGWETAGDWRFSVALENALDKNYRIHGSGLNEAGRNFVVSLIRDF